MHRWFPPPVAMLVTAGLMALLARMTPALAWTFPGRTPLAVAVAIVGVALAVAGARELVRHRTTINPMRPEGSEQLVRSGVFAWSRNPIYLADAVLLAGWAVYLGHALAPLLLALFVAYIHVMQIRPEEAALEARFGDAFRAYRDAVRAWL